LDVGCRHESHDVTCQNNVTESESRPLYLHGEKVGNLLETLTAVGWRFDAGYRAASYVVRSNVTQSESTGVAGSFARAALVSRWLRRRRPLPVVQRSRAVCRPEKPSHRTAQHRRRGRAPRWFPVAYADRSGAGFPPSRGAEESAACCPEEPSHRTTQHVR